VVSSPAPGPLALVGGGEWREGSDLDAELVARSGGEVFVLPTAAAYERPERAVATARAFFDRLGAKVVPVMALSRADAEDPAVAGAVRAAPFVYLSGGSPLHLRSVLKGSALLHALRAAWYAGAIVAGSSAGAMVLTDPMVDPRGGAFTVGLGFVRDLAVVPHYRGELTPALRRTLELAPPACALVALAEQTAVVREPDGTWRSAGPGPVAVYVDGQLDSLAALAGKPLGD
jgi:cyanophycinase